MYWYWYWYLNVGYWYLYWYLDHWYWYWYWYLFVEYLIQDCSQPVQIAKQWRDVVVLQTITHEWCRFMSKKISFHSPSTELVQ